MDRAFMDELLNYIEIGNYIPTACAAMGISEASYFKWLRDGRLVAEYIAGRDDEQELHDALMEGEIVEAFSPLQCRCYLFLNLASKAQARSESAAVAMVRKHSADQWTAAMTFLERRFPGRWKRKEQIDIGDGAQDTGVDEQALLTDPTAVKLIHDALERASRAALESGAKEEITDATVVEDAEESTEQA
jgi:hypothetical protein